MCCLALVRASTYYGAQANQALKSGDAVVTKSPMCGSSREEWLFREGVPAAFYVLFEGRLRMGLDVHGSVHGVFRYLSSK
jgi:hypothetical protein